MLRDFEVNGFKKFSSLRFDNLGNVNILLGRNNVGKTTMLEALYAHACGENAPLLISESILRTDGLTGPYDFAEKLMNGFHQKDRSPFSFSTCGTDDQGAEHRFEHQFSAGSIFAKLKSGIFGDSDFLGNIGVERLIPATPIKNSMMTFLMQRAVREFQESPIGQWITSYNGQAKEQIPLDFPSSLEEATAPNLRLHMNCKFVDILSHRDENENRNIYALLKRENMLPNFVSEISKIFENVKGFDMLPYPDGTNGPVSVVTEQGYIPLSNFGDGLQRYFHIIGGLFLYRNGIHCIEEVDATFHPEAQEAFSKSLLFFSSLTNNQVFMSSHNAEFVDNFLKAVSSAVGESGLEKIRVITMKNTKDNQVRVRTLTGTEALIRRNDYEMELR